MHFQVDRIECFRCSLSLLASMSSFNPHVAPPLGLRMQTRSGSRVGVACKALLPPHLGMTSIEFRTPPERVLDWGIESPRH